MESQNNQRATVRPLRFYKKYVGDGAGGLREVDWVEYAGVGNAKYLTTPDAIARVQKLTDGTWECIKPAYEAWKSGDEVPLTGTPLAAWSGVSPEQAEILKIRDIRTVEDVAQMTDRHMEKIGIPEIRRVRDMAKAWLDSKDNRKLETEMADKDERIALLEQQISEMMAMLQPGEEPKRRGRPPKARDEEEAA